MNPTETMDTIVLRVERTNTDPAYTTSGEFKKLCLQIPCHGCGSRAHSLLRPMGATDKEGLCLYEYCCTIITHEPLYPTLDKQTLRISYELETEKYAEDCHYDEDEAIARAPFLGKAFQNSPEYPPYMDSFMNEVKLICRWKALQSLA